MSFTVHVITGPVFQMIFEMSLVLNLSGSLNTNSYWKTKYEPKPFSNCEKLQCRKHGHDQNIMLRG